MENPSIPAIYTRSCSILGNDAMHRLSQKKVIIFGIGGVGSWCAEGLIRTGLKHLTIVDSDNICVTNINRQLMATCKTIGQPKTQVMQRRLLEINPQADITALSARYTPDSAVMSACGFISRSRLCITCVLGCPMVLHVAIS